MWLADVDGVTAGLLVLTPDATTGLDGTGWIDHLYLDPSWIGRGLGDRFVDLAQKRYPGGLQLWTFKANAPAQRFYERRGFLPVEFTDGSRNEERSPDIRYRWG